MAHPRLPRRVESLTKECGLRGLTVKAQGGLLTGAAFFIIIHHDHTQFRKARHSETEHQNRGFQDSWKAKVLGLQAFTEAQSRIETHDRAFDSQVERVIDWKRADAVHR